MTIGAKILAVILTVIFAFLIGIIYMGIRRKVIARAQNRYGPPIHQNIFDIFKLWFKESNIQHGVLFHIGPLFMIAMAITILLFVPIAYPSNFWVNFSFKGDLILLLYLMPFGPLGMALGVGQTGNPNSAIGVTRGLALLVGYEIPFVIALIAVMIQYHTTSLTDLIQWQRVHHTWIAFTSPLAFITVLMILPAMFRYAPYDVVVAPRELASGPMSELGGKYLGSMMTASSIYTFTKLALIVDIFLGGASSWLMMIVKTLALYMVPVLWAIVNPRYRTDQALRVLWGWPLIFAIVSLIIAAV